MNKYVFPYIEYSTKNERLNKLNKLILTNKQKNKFNNNIYLIGYGCVGKVLLVMILRMCNIDPKNIIVIDKNNLSNIKLDVVIKDNTNVDEKNYKEVFKNLANGDIIVETCYSIDTLSLLKLCQETGASHINSCIDIWDYKYESDPYKYSLHHIHTELDKYNKSLGDTKNFNSIISMGCNPGCVSIWNKVGIKQIWKKKFNSDIPDNMSYAELAHKLEIQTIHISEKDTQRVSDTKKINEYCNTWSGEAESYYEELLGPVEASWGTHEDKNYNNMDVVKKENYLIWKKMGGYVYAQSWVPMYGRYIGNIVRHDESYTIGRFLTIKNIYCPSVYYVYHPTNEAMASVSELKEKNHKYQENTRLLTNEIIDGNDLLGLTYYLKDGTSYFIGSMLGINEARMLYENKYDNIVNSTNIQVVAGYISGIINLMKLNIKNDKKGLMCPDILPVEKFMKYQLPFIGDFVFVECPYDLIDSDNIFGKLRNNKIKNWTFDKFLIK